jgi:hypothetical protein
VRRTVFLLAILVPAGVLVGLLWDSGSGMMGSSPTLARKSGRDARTEASSRPRAIALAEGSGADLFLQSDAEALIDGRTVRYPRSYAAAASYASAGAGIVVVTEPIMVFNDRPRNEHDVARLLAIDVSGGSKRAARDLAAGFQGRTGIRARGARITGDVDLTRVSRIEFTGDVRATIVDTEVPDDEACLTTETLVLELDGREVVAIQTDDAFTITRPRTNDLVLSGRGFHADLQTRRATLRHDVRVEAALARTNEPSGPPFKLATPGPIELTIGAPPGRPRGFSLAGSRASTAAGVTFSQGDLSGVADDTTLSCNAASKVDSVDLAGSVHLESGGDVAEGSRLIVTPQDPIRFARMEGHPVAVRLGGQSASLPGAVGDEATLTTFGALTISPIRPGSDGRPGRSYLAGPGVSITSRNGEISASRAAAWKSEDAESEAPFRIAFENARGHDLESELRAGRLEVVRQGAGVATVDQVTLKGPYRYVYRPRAQADPSGSPAESRDVPKIEGNPVSIEGPGSLEVTIPLLDERPMVVIVREPFRMESIGTTPGKPKGSLEAEYARAELEASRAERLPGTAPARTLATFTAERRVRLELPDRARARGEKLSYDARERRLTLSGAGEREPAHVQRTNAGSRDWLEAGSIVFHQDLLLVVATSGVDAEIGLAPLPWIGDVKSHNGETIPTKVHAQRITASLDAARYADGQVSPTEVTAEVAVKLTQPDRVLSGDYLRFDASRRSASGRGAPLRYAVTRTIGETSYAEGLVCPSLTLEERTLIVDGPSEGRFHAKPFLPGKPLLAGNEPPRGASAPVALQAVTLRCRKRSVFGEEWIVADGRVEMEQSRPPDDGVSASADEAIIFLEKVPLSESRPTDTDVGLVILKGRSKYVSRDFDAACDVMKLNQVTKLATFFNETPTPFTIMIHRQVFNSEVENEVSRLDVDFKEPGTPKVTIRGHEMRMLPESRSASR